ncbi:MAG: TetR/AcrR family transcriptional regulator [Alphaproteobacteria bacterium]
MAQDGFESGRKDAILRAAEVVFAERSYEAASIRTIAAAAGVNPALVGYYFGSKADLYREIFTRRYRDITEDRLRLLAAVEIVPGRRETVAAILAAWFGPFVARLDSAGSRNFVRLLAREAVEPSSHDRDIVATYLDPSARQCMQALATALPSAPPQAIAWGYQFCIAVMLSCVTGARRANVLAGTDEAGRAKLADMVAYATAGLLAIAGGADRQS